jgi:hypothetical protein
MNCAICNSERGEKIELLTDQAFEQHAREVHRDRGVSGSDLKMLSSPFPADQVTPETFPGLFPKR